MEFSRPTTNDQRSCGPAFTLVELLVVVAIMGIVMSISVYQFRRGEVRQNLSTAADDIKAAWQEMQARTLAGTRTPQDAFYYGGSSGGGLAPAGYGLLLYGTVAASGIDPSGSVVCPENGGLCYYFPTHQFIDPSFVFQACAVPAAAVVPSPDRSSIDRCFVPVPGYSPVMPPTVYVDKPSIRVGVDAAHMYPFLLSGGDDWNFRSEFNFHDCDTTPYVDPDGQDGVSLSVASIFLGIEPPNPGYSMNGYSGCRLLQFELKSTESSAPGLWVRFDLNTGTVRTFDQEPTSTDVAA